MPPSSVTVQPVSTTQRVAVALRCRRVTGDCGTSVPFTAMSWPTMKKPGSFGRSSSNTKRTVPRTSGLAGLSLPVPRSGGSTMATGPVRTPIWVKSPPRIVRPVPGSMTTSRTGPLTAYLPRSTPAGTASTAIDACTAGAGRCASSPGCEAVTVQVPTASAVSVTSLTEQTSGVVEA